MAVSSESSEMPLTFLLTTAPQIGHPHPEYTHRCDVTLFGRAMWSLWGKSAEEATKAARFEVTARVTMVLGGGHRPVATTSPALQPGAPKSSPLVARPSTGESKRGGPS